MIQQPDRKNRNITDSFYDEERKRIDMLNREFFADISLSRQENDVLVWLCGWDEFTVNNLVSAFKKVV